MNSNKEKTEEDYNLGNLVRDLTTVIPKPKSEARRLILKWYKSQLNVESEEIAKDRLKVEEVVEGLIGKYKLARMAYDGTDKELGIALKAYKQAIEDLKSLLKEGED